MSKLPTLKLTAKNLYGTIRYFPDDPISIAIAQVKGGKTLLVEDLAVLKNAGFEIEISKS